MKTKQPSHPISLVLNTAKVVLCLAIALLAAPPAIAQQGPVIVGGPVTPLKVTIPRALMQVQSPANADDAKTVPEGEPLPTAVPPRHQPIFDPVFQLPRKKSALGPLGFGEAVSAPIVNVPGMFSSSNPPDTTGDVGPNHFVQMVNATRFQVFDKAGAPLTAPITFGTLWTPATGNSGDPIVVYDHLADRWVLTQFFTGGMYFAVSQTPDPTAGTWYLYTFTTAPGVLPDYPKVTVWPDGYYMSTYESPNHGIHAFERTQMLIGAPADFVKTTIPVLTPSAGVRDTRILPADLDGTAPPANTPCYFLRTVDGQQDTSNPVDRIQIYEAQVNWAGPTINFPLVNTLTPAAFNIMVGNRNGSGIRDMIPQPNTTATVDGLSNRPMMQLKYRLIGGVPKMVVCQTIDISGSIQPILGFTPADEVAGIRWYQLEKPAANWVIGQQGTFGDQPPTATNESQLLHRWMGSAAMNGAGDIALGYSICNDDDTNPIFPGIRYTGRLAGDTPGTMPQGEGIIVTGTASKGANGSFGNRWGDYAQMGVDPTDDNTFWYTSHVASGQTHIASFKILPNTPTVTAPTSVSTTATNVTLGGNVTSEGGSAVTERGVVYALTSVNGDPVIGGAGVTKVTSPGTTGVFTVNISGLTTGQGYSFKAYATNTLGTAYTTPASTFTQGAPTVTTPTSAGITSNSATLGGNVTNDVGSAVTERGVVYSVSSVNADPIIGGPGVTKLTSPGSTGVFTVNASSLTPATGYSFKAYAINGAGTTYTTPASTFTTLPVVPTVTTPTQTNITAFSGTLGGNVTSTGGAAITERGVVYSITSVNADPLIGGTGVTKLTSAGTTGVFTVNASGLTQSTGYSFKAYATNSVGTTYTTPASTFTTLVAVPLTGTKTVGAGGDFTSLTNAGGLFEAINNNGVNGALNVQIIGNLAGETGAVALNAVVGTTPSVKIFPAGAARSITGTIAGALIRLNGADNVTLDGSLGGTGADRSLTITNTSTTTPTVIALISLGTGQGATNNEIKNCNISTGVAASIGYAISVGGSTPGTTGADNDNVTMQNNAITAAPIGIYAAGTSSASAGGDDNLSITGNSIDYNSTLASVGIRVGNARNSLVSQNTVSEQTTAIQAPTAISLETGFVSSLVTRNTVTKSLTTSTGGYAGRGITVGTGTAVSALTIANNFIYGVNGSNWSSFTNSSAMGIVIGTIGNSTTLTTTTGGVNLYYNSVNMTGSMGTVTSALTTAIYIGSGASGLDVRNNIFVNTQEGTSTTQKNYAIYSAAASTAFTTINFNDYFVSNSFNAASAIPGFLASDRLDLAGIQAGFGQNLQSLTADPLFTSATDLHLASILSPASDAGTPIAAVLDDYDGAMRSLTSPDIGADEVTALPTVTAPTSVSTTATNATLGGNVTSQGGSAVSERGVVYALTSVNSDPVIGGPGVTKVTSPGTTGVFTVNISGLTAGLGYSFKVYATNSLGTAYTTPASTFTQGAPTVTTPTSAGITASGATLGGNVTDAVGSAIVERGVVYSVSSVNADPVIGGTGVTKLTSPGSTGVFTVNATGLIPVTGYSFKAYAINGAGTTYTTPVSSFTTLAGPEIAVEQPVGTGLTDGTGTQNFGSVQVGGNAVLTFTVRNVGGENLTGLLVSKDGVNSANFAVGTLGAVTLAPAASTTFTVTFAPGAVGVRNAAIHIASNDADENPFDIALTGTGFIPDIAVEQPEGTGLVDGVSTVAFGNVIAGAILEKRFAIRNTGTGTLTLASASIDGANASDFSVASFSDTVLPVGETGYLDVTFSPSTLNARSAALHIVSNDPDESPFDIALTGSGTTAAGPILLARDINQVAASLSPGLPVVIAGVAYFQGTTVGEGVELWRTDGSAAGTFIVRDNFVGTSGGGAGNLTNFNGTLFFTSNSGSTGTELFKSDGTNAGTVLVKDIVTGTTSSSPANLTPVAATLFFTATGTGSGAELWKSDGTNAGTVQVADIATGTAGSSPANLRNVNGTLFFTANNGLTGVELWKSDGTPVGTVPVADIATGTASSSPANLTVLGSTLIFTVNDGVNGTELWSSDGTTTALLKDINPGSASSSPGNFVRMGGVLYFSAFTSTEGTELWKTDGTAAGTVLVSNIASGTTSSSPTGLVVVGSTLYFSATTTANGREPWKSDGTSAGTVLVRDIVPGTVGSTPVLFTEASGSVYFSAVGDGLSDRELWKTDGTSIGTVLVKDINPGVAASSLANFANLAGTLIFSANDALSGTELWKSDGNWAGTVPILDGQPGSNLGSVTNLRAANGVVFFSANDGIVGAELWKSDGSVAGTLLVSDIAAGATSSNPANLTNIGSTLYFTAFDSANGTELRKSDGTAVGTVLVANISTGSASSSPTLLTPVGPTLFCSANDGTNGAELWKSDGTAAGTSLVLNINATAATGSALANLTDFNGTLFFSANDGVNGQELWKSDGTPGGTVLVKDINPGSVSSSPANLRVLGSKLFFTATTAANGTELWMTDGTTVGTVLVADIAFGIGSSFPSNLTVVGSTLFFSASNGGFNGTELWKTGATGAGTGMVADINPGTLSSSPFALADINGTLYFRATTATEGAELWKSDGTGAGTVLVSDINPGTTSSTPTSITNVNGVALMNATTAAGAELWQSDGTGAGTALVADLMPGATSSGPANLTVLGNLLFFTARGPDLGFSELFVVAVTPPAEIAVEEPAGSGLADGVSTTNFGLVTLGTATVRTYTIRNEGAGSLTGLSVSKDGTNSGDFTVGSLGATTLATGTSTTFSVTFSPGAAGARNAAIHIASNDADENPFDVSLTGTGLTRLENWRLQYFGSTANSGDGADGNDFEFDGMVNFLEFCLGTHPKQATQIPQSLVKVGGNLEFTYQRAKAAVLDGVVFAVKWNDSLTPGVWNGTGVTEMILSDNGIVQQVKATLPAGAAGQRFVRLEATGM